MANHNGGCDNPEYNKYSSEDTELNLTMDYISGWKFSETRGSYGSYAQVQFYGEVKGDFAPTIIVKVEDESKLEIEAITAKAKADDVVAKRLKLPDAELISMSEKEFLGFSAVLGCLKFEVLLCAVANTSDFLLKAPQFSPR